MRGEGANGEFLSVRLVLLCVAGTQPFTGKARLRPGWVDFTRARRRTGRGLLQLSDRRVSKVEWLER
jgi:hypothetical protein